MYKSGKEDARGEKSWYSTQVPHVCTNVKRVFEGSEKLVSHECNERKYVKIDIFTQETRVSSGRLNAGERKVMYGETEVHVATSRVPASQTGPRALLSFAGVLELFEGRRSCAIYTQIERLWRVRPHQPPAHTLPAAAQASCARRTAGSAVRAAGGQ